MPKPRKANAKAVRPQFDVSPLDDEDLEGACPIPDDDGEIVLRRDKKSATKGVAYGKDKNKKPARRGR